MNTHTHAHTHAHIQLTKTQRSALAVGAVAAMSLGFAPPLLAATAVPATATQIQPAHEGAVPSAKAARKCLNDVHAFETQMQKGGYWLYGSGLGYGYPINGYGYDQPILPASMGTAGSSSAEYRSARPGYEIRTLIASATILAQRGSSRHARRCWARRATSMAGTRASCVGAMPLGPTAARNGAGRASPKRSLWLAAARPIDPIS